MLYIVTVKLEKNPEHDPRDKHVGGCPVPENVLCTDTTGQHHSLLVEASDHNGAVIVASRHGFQHVTRVESIGLPLI